MDAKICPYHGGHTHLCQAFGPDELANNYYLRKKLALGGWRKENLIQSVYCSDTASSSATSSYYVWLINHIDVILELFLLYRSQGAGARYSCQIENLRRCRSVLPILPEAAMVAEMATSTLEMTEGVMQDVEAYTPDDALHGMD